MRSVAPGERPRAGTRRCGVRRGARSGVDTAVSRCILQPVSMSSSQIQTIADIARVTGVSKATVSRALNDSPLVATETKERIQEVAREHGFQMNASARRL